MNDDIPEGRVLQQGGDHVFYCPVTELRVSKPLNEQFPIQPSQSKPRTNWNHMRLMLEDSDESRRRFWIGRPRLGVSVDEMRQIALSTNVAPLVSFEDTKKSRTTNWQEHLVNIHCLLDAVMLGKEPMGDAIIGGLTLAIRGLEDVILVAAQPVNVPEVHTNEGPSQHSLFLEGTYLPAVGESTMRALSCLGFPSNEFLRSAMHNRRFIVIPFRHQIAASNTRGHMTMGVFDRKKAQFMHWDTLHDDSVAVKARARNAIALLQVILAYNSMPLNFTFYCMPITPQIHPWQSTLILLEIIRQLFRGLVGLKFETLQNIVGSEVLPFGNKGSEEGSEAVSRPTLLFRDWPYEPWLSSPQSKAGADQLDRVKARWRLLALEELGVWDCLVIDTVSQRFVTPRGYRTGDFYPTWSFVQTVSHSPEEASSTSLRMATQRADNLDDCANRMHQPLYTQHGGPSNVIDKAAIFHPDPPNMFRLVKIPSTRNPVAPNKVSFRPAAKLRENLLLLPLHIPYGICRHLQSQGWYLTGVKALPLHQSIQNPNMTPLGRRKVEAASDGDSSMSSVTVSQGMVFHAAFEPTITSNAGPIVAESRDTESDNMSLLRLHEKAYLSHSERMEGVEASSHSCGLGPDSGGTTHGTLPQANMPFPI
ncbi:hypothetical protein FALBO_9344 [Fusarium albosuccineum]|uniref:Uncharacterized protein n=1 Tax=Fusarium albosuccineum TaxID=1237068 RepID=A0A8H4L7Y9_9HYPO|nr:hypothetical protein FALBO_9344 [Fusarium albosuccineum]